MKLKPIIYKINFMWSINHLPIEFKIFCHRGYHSVLAIKFDWYSRKFLVCNYAKNITYWLNWKKLKKMQNKNVNLISWQKI
jgi:hypothetical protein